MKIIISYIGLKYYGVFLGDAITMLQVFYEVCRAYPRDTKVLLLHEKGEFNFLFEKVASNFGVICKYVKTAGYDDRKAFQDLLANTLTYEGEKYDLYVELYPRLDGGPRQGFLCGYEKGLGKQGVIEYYYYGQRGTKDLKYKLRSLNCIFGSRNTFPEYDIFYAPYEKCQGNAVFTLAFHDILLHTLVDKGYKITLNVQPNQYQHLAKYVNIKYPPERELFDEIRKHKLVIAGNTGIGWAALLAGVPLFALEHRFQNLLDFNFFRHDNSSLYAYLEIPHVELSLFIIESFFRNEYPEEGVAFCKTMV